MAIDELVSEGRPVPAFDRLAYGQEAASHRAAEAPIVKRATLLVANTQSPTRIPTE
jgi:hypothetical protein